MRFLIFILILPKLSTAHAQELVPNGDFETYSTCPDYPSQIERAIGWSRPTEGTSDYLNACLGVPFSLSVPDNQFGIQEAHSGTGYAGFFSFSTSNVMWVPSDPYREYVTHELSAPLIPGGTYAVEFFVSLADHSKYAVKYIGALFSVEVPYRPDMMPIEAEPHINSSGEWLADKSEWTRIAGCFVADSAYSFITIGNFRNSINIELLQTATDFPLSYDSYYYIDDVSVSPVDQPQLGPDVTACNAVAIAVQQPIAGISYAWSNSEIGNSITVDSSGTYWVNAEIQGCNVSDTIEVLSLPTIDLSMMPDTVHDFCLAPSIELFIDSLPPQASIEWSTGHSGNSIFVDHPGIYDFTVNSPDHCPALSQLIVHDSCEHPVFFPNTFTPNGDGINDDFQPVFDPWTTHVEYMIFDRWGREVFQSEGGSWSGSDLPQGIYGLQFTTGFIDQNKQRVGQGHVVLIR